MLQALGMKEYFPSYHSMVTESFTKKTRILVRNSHKQYSLRKLFSFFK